MTPSDRIGKYKLLAKIADGGMAEVFLAVVDGIGGFQKHVALKLILSHFTRDSSFIQSFVNEARICGQLHHPNLVQVYEFHQVDENYFLAMEFIDGLDLERIINHRLLLRKPIPPQVAVAIVLQMLEGLEYAHSARDMDNKPLHVIHRDLKPSNVLIDLSGLSKIVDFGVAKASTNLYKTMNAGLAKGTVSYMSPEQAAGRMDLLPASDLFSVGSILYELLTLRRLFDGDNLFAILDLVRTAPLEPAFARLKDAPPSLQHVLHKALTRELGGRYHSAGEMLRDLRPVYPEGASQSTLMRFMEELKREGLEPWAPPPPGETPASTDWNEEPVSLLRSRGQQVKPLPPLGPQLASVDPELAEATEWKSDKPRPGAAPGGPAPLRFDASKEPAGVERTDAPRKASLAALAAERQQVGKPRTPMTPGQRAGGNPWPAPEPTDLKATEELERTPELKRAFHELLASRRGELAARTGGPGMHNLGDPGIAGGPPRGAGSANLAGAHSAGGVPGPSGVPAGASALAGMGGAGANAPVAGALSGVPGSGERVGGASAGLAGSGPSPVPPGAPAFVMPAPDPYERTWNNNIPEATPAREATRAGEAAQAGRLVELSNPWAVPPLPPGGPDAGVGAAGVGTPPVPLEPTFMAREVTASGTPIEPTAGNGRSRGAASAPSAERSWATGGDPAHGAESTPVQSLQPMPSGEQSRAPDPFAETARLASSVVAMPGGATSPAPPQPLLAYGAPGRPWLEGGQPAEESSRRFGAPLEPVHTPPATASGEASTSRKGLVAVLGGLFAILILLGLATGLGVTERVARLLIPPEARRVTLHVKNAPAWGTVKFDGFPLPTAADATHFWVDLTDPTAYKLKVVGPPFWSQEAHPILVDPQDPSTWELRQTFTRTDKPPAHP